MAIALEKNLDLKVARMNPQMRRLPAAVGARGVHAALLGQLLRSTTRARRRTTRLDGVSQPSSTQHAELQRRRSTRHLPWYGQLAQRQLHQQPVGDQQRHDAAAIRAHLVAALQLHAAAAWPASRSTTRATRCARWRFSGRSPTSSCCQHDREHARPASARRTGTCGRRSSRSRFRSASLDLAQPAASRTTDQGRDRHVGADRHRAVRDRGRQRRAGAARPPRSPGAPPS